MNFILVSDGSQSGFEKTVNTKIAEGYTLAGMTFHAQGQFFLPMSKAEVEESIETTETTTA